MDNVMTTLIWRIALPLVLLLTFLILVVMHQPVTSSPPTVICSTWHMTDEDSIRVVDYLCNDVPLPDFTRYMTYECPPTMIHWPEADEAGVEVELKGCKFEEPGGAWRAGVGG